MARLLALVPSREHDMLESPALDDVEPAPEPRPLRELTLEEASLASPAAEVVALDEALAPLTHEHLLREVTSAFPALDAEPSLEGDLLDLQSLEKRLQTWFAFVPFWGAVRIQRSTLHTSGERRTLGLLSVLATLVMGAAFWAAFSLTDDTSARRHSRVDAELGVLVRILERYRTTHGVYPDQALWRQSVARADLRFFDPWGRPYEYEGARNEFTIRVSDCNGIPACVHAEVRSESDGERPSRGEVR